MDLYFFASASEAFYYWASELYWEGWLWCFGAGDRVAGSVWATHGVYCVCGFLETGIGVERVNRCVLRREEVSSMVLRALSGRDDGGPIGTLVGLMSDSKRHRWLSQRGTLHRHFRRGGMS